MSSLNATCNLGGSNAALTSAPLIASLIAGPALLGMIAAMLWPAPLAAPAGTSLYAQAKVAAAAPVQP